MIMMRTPYGISAGGNRYSRMLYENADFFADGYIFVFQDIRGRNGSEGTFEMNRPLHDAKDSRAVDESTDAYDTDGLVAEECAKNSGRVGIWGFHRHQLSRFPGDDGRWRRSASRRRRRVSPQACHGSMCGWATTFFTMARFARHTDTTMRRWTGIEQGRERRQLWQG
jgi:hypothetical protein